MSRLFPMLACRDLERSIAVYRDLLGGELSYRFPGTGEPAFVTLRLGDSELGLGVAERDTGAPGIQLCVYVEDVDATVAAWHAASLPVLKEPADMPWGERMATVADPDGYMLVLTA